MPKIVLGISSSFCAHFLKGQIAFLNQNGYQVVVISGKGEEISMLCKAENARLYDIGFTKRFSILGDVRLLYRIIQILKKENPDIVNAGNPKSGFLIMLACYCIGFRKRIFTLHGLLSDAKKGMAQTIISLTEKISCGIARKVIAVSPSLAAHAAQRGILDPAKAVVIGQGSSNGLDLSAFTRTPEVLQAGEHLARSLHVSDQDIIITFIGRINKDKGVDLLFEAFDALKKDYPQLRLLVAGPIEDNNPIQRKNLNRLYQDDRVFYMGKLYEVAHVYAISSILVLPSYREGFGNVLIEAAAMEVPVIAPNIPGCRDAMKAGYNGLSFEKGNARDLTAQLLRYLQDPALRAAHGGNGRRFVTANFRQEDIWQGQLEVYRAL
jgi:glycosyltransferase involved in cell wall biosynthesis